MTCKQAFEEEYNAVLTVERERWPPQGVDFFAVQASSFPAALRSTPIGLIGGSARARASAKATPRTRTIRFRVHSFDQMLGGQVRAAPVGESSLPSRVV